MQESRAERVRAIAEAIPLDAWLEATSEVVLCIGAAGSIRVASGAVRDILGCAPDGLVGKRIFDLFRPEDVASAHELLRPARPSEAARRGEFGILRQDGKTALLDVRARFTPNGVLLVARDVTREREVERRLQRQADRAAALRTVDLTLTVGSDWDVTLRAVLESALGDTKADAAAIHVWDPASKELELVMHWGFRSGSLDAGRISVAGVVADGATVARRTRIVSDPSALGDPVQRALWEQEGFRCAVIVPVGSGGTLQGMLEVFHRSRPAYDAEAIDFLEALGRQAAIAIVTARTFERLRRSASELGGALDAILEGWARALELRAWPNEGHTRRVTEATVLLSQRLGIDESQLVHVRRGAMLHDIGEIGVPDAILGKCGPLTSEEWEDVRKHPGYGYELLSPITYLQPALDIPHYHHERWDGSGYPAGLAGDDIPLPARIFSVVDAWDAMRSDRPYQRARADREARREILARSGSHFDPEVVDAFMSLDLERHV